MNCAREANSAGVMENLGNLAEILRARGADSQKGAIRGTIGCGLVLSGQLATDAGYIVECLFIFIGTTANIVMLILPRVLKTLGNIAKGETDQTILQVGISSPPIPSPEAAL